MKRRWFDAERRERLSTTHPRPATAAPLLRTLIRPSETAAICGLLAAALFCFRNFAGIERFAPFTGAMKAVDRDEILFVLTLGGIAALYLAIRRAADLRREKTMRVSAERRAMELAHDPVTGLPNRQLLFEAIWTAIAANEPFAVLMIDLDKFKPVNDLHGHDVGDQLLKEVANRLTLLDDRLFIARLGGDEFVCLMSTTMGSTGLGDLASSIIDELSGPFVISGRTLAIGATVGLATFPQDGRDAARLLSSADLAMYCAKRASRGTFTFYHPDLDSAARARAELELDIREALTDGQIKPYFQPIHDLRNNEVCGYEALARWEHPMRGVIEPAAFLPIIEDLGLQDQLLDTVIGGAAEASNAWDRDTSLAVNISASQLQNPLFAARLLTLLHHVGFSAPRLMLEVTEKCVDVDNAQLSITFAHLRSAGIRIVLDDFGKSYANLAALRKLKFSNLKIHGSFLQMAEDPDRNVLHAIVALARELGLPVSAQNVETPELADLLARLGCTHAQGYYFGRAMPCDVPTQVMPMLSARQTIPTEAMWNS